MKPALAALFFLLLLSPDLLAQPGQQTRPRRAWLREQPAQVDEQAIEELLENFFRDNEAASESDAQLFLENLQAYRERPLDLNRATAEDLQEMRLLNDIQIANFMDYRRQFGPFLSHHELQAVPTWDLDDIRRMLLFSRVGGRLEERNTRIVRGFAEGENELILRAGHTEPRLYPSGSEGGPNTYGLRYRHSFDNRLRFGLTADNDPGEAFFEKSNPQGFDFYSAHLFAQNLNRTVRSVALGDYTARFGQGLLLQMGFAANKSAESIAVTRSGRKLNAYAAFGEVRFFRGAATTLAFGKHWEITALYSDRRRDANLADTSEIETDELPFTSIQTSGLHRTPSEVADENALREQVGGLSATYLWRDGQITANGLSIRFDKPWEPQYAAYRRYAFQGKQLDAASVDYNWRRRNWHFFGEMARSGNGGTASLNGLLITPDPHITLAALHRSLGKDYQSIYGNPFAEVTGASNEQGLYLGTEIRYIRRWKINLYADVWRHPWLRSEVSAPSRGREYLAQVHWTKSKTFSAYVMWRAETKERDSNVPGLPGLLENRISRLRFHAVSKVSPAVEFRSRIEWTTAQLADFERTRGFVAFQEAVVKPLGSPLSGAVRYALFDTDNFDTRVFLFENDLFTALSIPAFSGRGSRYYLNLQWRLTRWLRLEGRVEQTNQVRAVTSTPPIPRRTGYKVLLRMRW
jgi:hypothetical protein